MYDRTGNYLIVAILIGMILGVVTVAIFGEAMLPVKFLGDIFLNALKMVVIPLLFCSMIVGISNLGDVRKLGRTGLKTLLYFVATSSIAVAIGLILVNIIQPGVGFGTFGAALPEAVQSRESYSFFAWLTDQIPSNIIGAAAETKVLPIIVFALFFGGVLTTIGSKGKPVIAFFEGLNEAIMKIVHIIMWFAPIGIFGLVAGQLAAQGGMSGFTSVLAALGKYSLVVILGLFIHGVIILPLILKFKGGKSPVEYFVGMSQALMTAFATASSSATLPVSMDCVEEKNDIDKRASSFVLPLGATINMDGTALYEAVAAMFIAQAYGIDLSILAQITIFATAVLASVGAAGIPQAGLVTMVLVLQAVGLPLEGIGLILAIDWFLDRCRTTVNVWGDSIGAAVIATTAEIGLIDRSRVRVSRGGRTERFRSSGRQKDPRYKKKSQGSAASHSRDRKQARGKKGTGPAKDANRQPARATKKHDRYGDKRKTRNDTPIEGFRSTAQKEEYKPSEGTPKPKAVRTKPVKAEKTDPNEKRGNNGSSQKKTAFGRKQTRPTQNRSKSMTDEEKRVKSETVRAEKPANQAQETKEKPGFEIPKFPATILADLVSVQDAAETEATGANLDMKSDSYQKDESKSRQRDDFPADDSPRSGKKPLMKKSSNDNPPPVSEKTEGDIKSADDFSRLDKAVLGASDKPEPVDSAPSPSPTEKDTPVSAKSDNSFAEPAVDLPSANAPDKPEEVSVETSGHIQQEPQENKVEEISVPTPSPETEKSDDQVSISTNDSIEEKQDMSLPAAETTPPTPTPSLSSDESPIEKAEKKDGPSLEAEAPSDKAASDDKESKDDSMKWGRSKRKKMSR